MRIRRNDAIHCVLVVAICVFGVIVRVIVVFGCVLVVFREVLVSYFGTSLDFTGWVVFGRILYFYYDLPLPGSARLRTSAWPGAAREHLDHRAPG